MSLITKSDSLKLALFYQDIVNHFFSLFGNVNFRVTKEVFAKWNIDEIDIFKQRQKLIEYAFAIDYVHKHEKKEYEKIMEFYRYKFDDYMINQILFLNPPKLVSGYTYSSALKVINNKYKKENMDNQEKYFCIRLAMALTGLPKDTLLPDFKTFTDAFDKYSYKNLFSNDEFANTKYEMYRANFYVDDQTIRHDLFHIAPSAVAATSLLTLTNLINEFARKSPKSPKSPKSQKSPKSPKSPKSQKSPKSPKGMPATWNLEDAEAFLNKHFSDILSENTIKSLARRMNDKKRRPLTMQELREEMQELIEQEPSYNDLLELLL